LICDRIVDAIEYAASISWASGLVRQKSAGCGRGERSEEKLQAVTQAAIVAPARAD